MSITSFYFLALILIGALLYYILPKTLQWVELLAMSLIFYFTVATPYTFIWLLLSTISAYVATMLYAHCVESGKGKRLAIIAGILAVLLSVGLWALLKASNIWGRCCSIIGLVIPIFAKIPRKINSFGLVAALGMGYYTLQIIGYILDCYWGNVKVQKNPLKLLLFVCFFPQMTTGPISRYQQLESLYEKHKFSYQNMCFGAQRILWGFFKKLVLAERVGIIVNGIWASLDTYTGLWRWVALLLFPIQMYADFSGCMDICLGAAEIFGIKMPENFRVPFFSKTVQEFWQRWHITLGSWAKDYVLYPLLKSSPMVKFGKFTRKKFGKKLGKFMATALGMLVLWIVMGIWHGGMKYIVGVSLWYWILLMMGELLSPYLKKVTQFLNIPEDSFSWHLFQSVRTYMIYAIGAVFFRAPGTHSGITFLQELCSKWNPWIFFDGSILKLGVTHQDLNIILFAILLLIIAEILRERYGHARDWIAGQILPMRWMIWIGLFVFVLIFGKYGPGYDAVQFIYQDF